MRRSKRCFEIRNTGRVFLLLWVRMPGDTAVEAPVGDNDKKIDEPVLLMSNISWWRRWWRWRWRFCSGKDRQGGDCGGGEGGRGDRGEEGRGKGEILHLVVIAILSIRICIMLVMPRLQLVIIIMMIMMKIMMKSRPGRGRRRGQRRRRTRRSRAFTRRTSKKIWCLVIIDH